MKKNPFYSFQTLSGAPYLLPFGQAVAERRPGVQLGGSGPLLWTLMDQCANREELTRTLLSRLNDDAPRSSEASNDVTRFLADLTALGILEPEAAAEDAARRAPRYADLCVGPLRVRLRGKPEWFHPDFTPYLVPAEDGAAVCQTVAVTEEMPPSCAGLTCLLQSSQLEVFRGADRLLLRFPPMPDISAAALSPDGSFAVFYLQSLAEPDRLRNDLFHAIRHAVLYGAQRRGLFALHSASILYRDRVWLFSAPSGTGKSTHAELWQTRYGVPVLNGDLALLSAENGSAVFHPMPWCGTSGIAVKETHPLGGIIFLRQGKENAASLLPPEERQLRLANRLISPNWTEAQLLECLSFAERLSGLVGMWQLDCTPAPESAACMKAAIDRFLEEATAHG